MEEEQQEQEEERGEVVWVAQKVARGVGPLDPPDCLLQGLGAVAVEAQAARDLFTL